MDTAEHERIFIKDGHRCWFVPLGDIRLFESEGNYARVYFAAHKPLLLRSLNYLTERLDPALFFRASRRHLVNAKWIERLEPTFQGGFSVTLQGGLRAEMSRRQAREFRQRTAV